VQVHPVLKSGGWTFGWDALAAIGTLILAIVTAGMAIATFRLARQAREEARAVKDNSGVVKEQVELQREQIEVAQTPLVVPAPQHGWTDGKTPYGEPARSAAPWADVLPVKNVGPGAALNVTGHIDFGPLFGDKPDKVVQLVPTSLASSESQDLCQWPSSSPHWRPSVLPGGGHVFSPLVATGSPRWCGGFAGSRWSEGRRP
jgi:hypothetical protein